MLFRSKGSVDADDFTNSSALTGKVKIDSSGSASFTLKTVADKLTEGEETARVVLYSDKQRTIQVGDAASVTINDTSKTPVKASYSLSIKPSSIDEGDSFRASVESKNVKDGTQLYYAIKGSVDADDFTNGSALTGKVKIDSSGQASFTQKTFADKLTEGEETARVVLYSDK